MKAEEKSGHLDYKDFLKMYNYCTKEPYSFMIIDARPTATILFKKSFDEPIDLEIMTRKEQNKILDDKIESNINQYKVDRLNAEISAFSSSDLNEYEFLTRKDFKYKPNALAKARFEFSLLGKAFSTGLDKTAVGYQEEGVIELLKDIKDGLANGVIRPNRPDNDDNRPDNDDDNRPDNDDDDRSDDEEEKIVIKHLLNEIDRINDINKQYKDTIKK